MANFCYDCTKDILGVDPTWNDFARGRIRAIPEDEFWKVLCEGCGVVVVDSKGKKVDDMLLKFSPRIDEDEDETYSEKMQDNLEPIEDDEELHDAVATIDVEIASCEQAIIGAYGVQEVEDLKKRIHKLSKKRREIEDA